MNDFNRDGGFTLSKAWDVVSNMLTSSKAKQREQTLRGLQPTMSQGFGQVRR